MTYSEVSNNSKIPKQLDLIIFDNWQRMMVMPAGCTKGDVKGATEVPINASPWQPYYANKGI